MQMRLGSGDADRRLAQRIAQTRAHLTDLPDLFASLFMYLIPGSAPQDPDQRSGRSNPAHRSIVNLDVVDLIDRREKANAEPTRTDYDLDRRAGARRQGVLPTLASWSRLVSAELWDEGMEHDEPADEATIVGECGFLLRHLSWAGRQGWFLEMHEDVRTIRADVRRAIGDRDPLSYTCPDCTWTVEERFDRQVFVCTGCERTWTMANEIDALVAEQASSRTIGECAKDVGKPVGTLHHWKAEGWISPAGWDRKKKCDLYDVRLVRRAAETIRNGRKTEVNA